MRDRLILAVLAVAATTAVALTLFGASAGRELAVAPVAGALPLILLFILAAAAGAIIYLHLSYRRALAGMRDAILQAQEGALLPVALPAPPSPLVRGLVRDYNALITSLGTTFGEMEECQNRVIGERNRNEAILHSLPGALLCVDSDHRINLCNQQAETLFKHTRDWMLGQSLFDLLQLDESGRELLRDTFLYEREIVNREMALRLDGEIRYFTLNLSFFRSRNLNEVGAAVILQDITDYKRLQESTYTSEKLMAMGQLAAGVAHELNTPLGNIIGYTRLIEQAGSGEGASIRHYTGIVSAEAKRCSRIVDDLLHYGRRDRCSTDTCEMNAVIGEVIATINDCQGRRHNVVVMGELAPEDTWVRGSAGQLDVVLVNLLLNAVQAASGRNAPRVVVRLAADPTGYAVVEVEDNGSGIPRELQRRIFDPFFTTKEVGEGTGLGLALSLSIVSRLGGSLAVDAQYTEGARLVLKLPLTRQEA